VSVDVNDCISAFRYLNKSEFRAPQIFRSMRKFVPPLLLASMKAAGLPLLPYELNTAVAAILGQDIAEKRWLRGEDVLAGQNQSRATSAGLRGAIENLSPQSPEHYEFVARPLAMATACWWRWRCSMVRNGVLALAGNAQPKSPELASLNFWFRFWVHRNSGPVGHPVQKRARAQDIGDARPNLSSARNLPAEIALFLLHQCRDAFVLVRASQKAVLGPRKNPFQVIKAGI